MTEDSPSFRPLRPSRWVSEFTDQGGPICPTTLTLPTSIPISSVLEQNVAVGFADFRASSVSSRSPLESEPWWTRNSRVTPALGFPPGVIGDLLDVRLGVGEDQAVLPLNASKTSRSRIPYRFAGSIAVHFRFAILATGMPKIPRDP